jgi:glycosyl hydrolase family 26
MAPPPSRGSRPAARGPAPASERPSGRRTPPPDGGRRAADWERNPDAWYRPAAAPDNAAVHRQPPRDKAGPPPPAAYPPRGEDYPRPIPGQGGRGGQPPPARDRPPPGGRQYPAGARRPAPDRFPAERRPAVPPRDPADQVQREYRRPPTEPAVRGDVALREHPPPVRRPPPPRPVYQPSRKRHHPWATIVLLSVGLIVATYGLVKFGYGPEKHQANVHPKTSETSATKKPAPIPSFPPPTHTVGMAINPPYSKSLPPAVKVLGKDPGIVESYLGFGGTFPLDQLQYLERQKIMPLIQINPKKTSLHFIAIGQYDKQLITLADQIKRVGGPVALSFAHEMNGWWYPWSVRVFGDQQIPDPQQVANRPMFFRAAWRHVWKVFQAQGVKNVTWVWTISRDGQRYGWPDLHSWWPGAKYVDWIGMNGYYRKPTDNFDYLYKDQLAILRTFTKKPVLITETGVGPGPARHTQIENLFAGIRRENFLGFIWFDVNANEHWNVDGNPGATRAFHTGIARYGY